MYNDNYTLAELLAELRQHMAENIGTRNADDNAVTFTRSELVAIIAALNNN